jgi:hypothetical protein
MSQTHKKIIVGLIVILILGLLWVFGRPKRAEAITDKREYQANASLDVSIQNNLGKNICFSSCYPYFVQISDGNDNWQNYEYGACADSNVVTSCVSDKGFKQFRLPLEGVNSGYNRLMIPVCLECQVGQQFGQDQVIYSNSFQVK